MPGRAAAVAAALGAAVAAPVPALPAAAWACASCIASAYGDRTFNWAYVGLILMPFALVVVVGGLLAWRYRAARRGGAPAAAPARGDFATKETT